MSVVPEVYYDIIGRLIPRGLILGIYFFNNLKDDLNFPTIVFAFICSYSVGFSLNFLEKFIWEAGAYVGHMLKVKPKSSADVWTKIRRELRVEDKVLMIKLFAEFAFFKSLTIEVVICMFFKPDIFASIITLNYLIGGCVLFLFFLGSAFYQKNVIYKVSDNLSNRT